MTSKTQDTISADKLEELFRMQQALNERIGVRTVAIGESGRHEAEAALRSREEVSRMLYESLRKHHDWAMDHDDGNYTSPACVSYQETVSALLAYAQANDQVKQPMG